MGAGQVVGALIGSHLILHHGTAMIRPVFITVTLTMTVALIWKQYAF